jgi:hypothetical protein
MKIFDAPFVLSMQRIPSIIACISSSFLLHDLVPLLLGYKHYGLNRGEHQGKKGLWYREWAPAAKVKGGVGSGLLPPR